MFKMSVYPLVKQRTCRMGLNHLRNLATVKRFFDPKNDVAFKKIFGEEQNKPLLLSFLNSILRREDDNMIEEVELLPQELPMRYKDFKKSILDVSCRDKKGHRYIVEMQNKKLSSFIQRIEYYASRTYSDQLPEGVDYLELKPVILLAIANHNIFPKNIPCISYHRNREEKTNICFLPNVSYVFVELPKFSKSSEQLETPEDYWIHLLKEAPYENEPPEEVPSEIQKAYEILERHRWSSAEIASYEKTMMAILDDEDAIRTAKNEGREEGREEGRKKGREEGRVEGRMEAKDEIAITLLKISYLTPRDISEATGLPVSKVEVLKYNIQDD